MLAALALVVLQDAPDPATYMEALTVADAALASGELERARASFDACLALDPENATATYGLACVASRAGRVDDAFAWLERALERGWVDARLARWDADLAPLRDDPRFDAWARVAAHGERGRARRELLVPAARAQETGVAAIGVRGTRVAVPLPQGALRILDANTGQVVADLEGHESMVQRVAYSPDGATLASYDSAGELRLWDVAQGVCRVTREAPVPAENILRRRIPLLGWVEEGRLLLSHGRGGLRVWDANGAPLGELVGRGPFAWCADGKWLARAEGKTVALFDVRATGAPDGELLEFEERVAGLALDALGQRLAVGLRSGDVHVYDVDARERCWSTFVSYVFDSLSVPELCFSRDGELLAFSTTTWMQVHVYDVESGTSRAVHDARGGRMGGIMSVAFGGAGNFLYMDCTTSGGFCIADLTATPTLGLRATEWTPDLDIDTSDAELAVRSFHGAATSVLDDATARELWRRHELADGTNLLQTAGGYFAGTARDLAGITIAEKRTGWPEPKSLALDALVPRLFDPKRVRASAAGVVLDDPRLWPE